MLESWRGRPFTPAELDGFDLKKVLGANCFLNIVHGNKGDKVYANIATVNPLPKGINSTKPENPVLFFSLDDMAGREITFPQQMPDWIKMKIMQSDEYIARQQDHSSPPVEEPAAVGPDGFMDEDVPF
jgi:hypothetical protein